MKYIIMCGGNYIKFKKPRPLYEIKGETLVERTIRLLKNLGESDIAISTNLEFTDFDNIGVPVIKFRNKFIVEGGDKSSGYWVEAFAPLNLPVCYLMGDVYYSEEALYQIVKTETDDILFFGTDAPYARGYSKNYQEPLAFKVVNQKKFRWACKEIKRLQDLGPQKWPFIRVPISWELAQLISNFSLNKIIVHTPIFVAIHSFAYDIDSIEDIKKLEEALDKYY